MLMSSAAKFMTLSAISGITGFATIAGDRHSFWAGVAAKALPPAAFEPVGSCLHHRIDLRSGIGRSF